MKSIIHLFLPIIFLIGLSFNSFAAIVTPSTIAKEKTKKESAFKQLSVEEIFTMPKKDIEAKIGRKLKFKEKLGLIIVQKAAKKAVKKRTKKAGNENLMGILSLTFGGLSFLGTLAAFGGSLPIFAGGFLMSIAGITLGIIGLKKKEPKRVLSILGIVFGGLSFLFGLLIILVIASFSLV